MMDGSYFAWAVLGLLGYIVGNFQREYRLRRESRAAAAAALARSHDRANQRAAALRVGVGAAPISDADRDGNSDGPAWALRSVRNGAARRRAVRGNNDGPRVSTPSVGRRVRGADAAPVMAGGGDFDGD